MTRIDMIAFFWSYGYDLKWFEFWALLEFRKFEEFSECFEHFENWIVPLGAYYRAILDSILLSLVDREPSDWGFFFVVLILILEILVSLKEIKLIKQEKHIWHVQFVSIVHTSLLLEGFKYPLQMIWYNSSQAEWFS